MITATRAISFMRCSRRLTFSFLIAVTKCYVNVSISTGRHIALEIKHRPHDVNPARCPVLFLIADRESQFAAVDFARSESLLGRFTFHYDCTDWEIGTLPPKEKLDRLGVHFIYKPHLSPRDIVKETWKVPYFGVRSHSKLVSEEVRSYVDQSAGTAISHFHDRVREKNINGEWYLLMNCPGQGLANTVDFLHQALLDAFSPLHFGAPALTKPKAASLSPAALGGLRGKKIALLGMDLAGTELARRLAVHGCTVSVYRSGSGSGDEKNGDGPNKEADALKRLRAVSPPVVPIKGPSFTFTRADAQLLGVQWKSSLQEAVRDADAVCLLSNQPHDPPSSSDPNADPTHLERLLPHLSKARVVLVNTGHVTSREAHALETSVTSRLSAGQTTIYYERERAPTPTAQPPPDPRKDAAEISELSVDHSPGESLRGKFPGLVKVARQRSRAIGAQNEVEVDYETATLAFQQLSDCVWRRQVTELPEGFIDLGVSYPGGVGPISMQQANRASANASDHLEVVESLKMLLEKRAEDGPWDRTEAMRFHERLNRLVRSFAADDADLIRRVYRDNGSFQEREKKDFVAKRLSITDRKRLRFAKKRAESAIPPTEGE